MRSRKTWFVVALLALGALEFGILGVDAAGFSGGSTLPPIAARGLGVASPTATPPPPTTGTTEPASIQLTPSPRAIHCDGSEKAHLAVRVFDAQGLPVPDGTPVYFSAYNGSVFGPYAKTVDGSAATDVVFYSDLFPQGSNLFASVGEIDAGIRIHCFPNSASCPLSPPKDASPSCTTPTPPLSPPQCDPTSPPPSPPKSISPPCGTPTPPLSPPQCDPTSPPPSPPKNVSPPCNPPTATPTRCSVSPPFAISPPCNATPVPPSPPQCNASSPPASVSPPCATPTPCPVSPPVVFGPCGGSTPPPSPPTPRFIVAIDCDPTAAGIQNDCTVAAATTTQDVDVIIHNPTNTDTTVGSFDFRVRDSNSSTLEPLPGEDFDREGNPDFNDGLPGAWYCIPPANPDQGTDGLGKAVSFLSCFESGPGAPVLPAGGELKLATVHYAVHASTPSDTLLRLTDLHSTNQAFGEIASCNPVNVTLADCNSATVHIGFTRATSTPSPAPQPSSTPTRTATRTATPAPARCTADVNGDGRVNLSDLRLVIAHFGPRHYDAKYDLNHDGKVNGRDAQIVVRQLGRRC